MTQEKKREAKFVKGNVGKQLFFGAIPMVFGIGAAIAFNFVDTVFIAKLGTKELAAITFTFPLVFVVIGIAMGLGTGASAVISKVIGEGDDKKTRRLTTDSILLALIVVAITVVLGIIFFEPIFMAMGADEETLPLVKEYIQIWLPGTIFLIVPMVGNYAIRATGDIKTPSYLMLIAVGINLVLDPILIFGLGPIPKLGLTGAALATLTGRFFTLIIAFRIVYYRDSMITLKPPTWEQLKESWKEILHVGLPTSASNILLPVGFGVITYFVSQYGDAAVAALGAASRVESLVMTVYMALGAVLSPFIGQNWGALKFDRIEKALKYSYAFSFLWGILMFGFFQLFAEPIAEFVKDDVNVVKYMVIYLGITPIAMAFRGVVMIASGGLNVLKKPITSSILVIAYMFVFFIPMAYFGSEWYGIDGIFWSLVFSAVITSIIAYYFLNKRFKELKLSVQYN